jgi:SAM-dependent methyltransferase
MLHSSKGNTRQPWSAQKRAAVTLCTLRRINTAGERKQREKYVGLPLKLGSPEEFRPVCEFLAQTFSEQAIVRKLGIDAIYDFKSTQEGRAEGEPGDRLSAMIRLFLDGDSLPLSLLHRLLGEGAFAAFERLDLVRQHPTEPGIWHATAALYPVEGLFIASDRPYAVKPGAGENVSPEYVYPAISGNTRRFLRALPPQPCESFLDLCSGSGTAALIAGSGYARHAWSLDITRRSTHFAEFNRLLNGVQNVTVLTGDLFDPVKGLTFDRIVAHPPYIPAAEQQMIFRDGGSDGEQITGAIIRDLPAYLRPGGMFYAVAQATDREGEPFEERIRKWLGDSSPEFDVLLLDTEVPPPDPFEQLVSARRRFKQILENKVLFSRLKVTGIFYGTILLRRHAQSQSPITSRVAQDRFSDWRLADWLLGWESDTLRPEFLQNLLNDRPKLSERMEMQVTHVNRGGTLAPERYRLQLRSPFVLDRECHPWVAVMLAGFDGATSGREAYEKLRRDEVISPEMPPEEFARMVAFFVSNGVVEVGSHALPSSEVTLVPSQRSPRNPDGKGVNGVSSTDAG